IYPNPASTSLNVSLQEELSFTATLYSMVGEKLLVTNSNTGTITLEISELKQGLYFLEVQTLDFRKTLPVIVNH
ncbi:MAG: T9SS type A sorting domain-containing protein, partial [Bacteroidales bacterium]